MKSNKIYLWLLMQAILTSCQQESEKANAYGNIEAVEVVESKETVGKILLVNAEEGKTYQKGELTRLVDTTSMWLQKQQLEDQKAAILGLLLALKAQLKVQYQQLENCLLDQASIYQLFKNIAIVAKRKDDVKRAVELVKAQRQAIIAHFDGIKEKLQVVQAQIVQLNKNIHKSHIAKPLYGTVQAKYAEAVETDAPGKALYKTADLSFLKLKVPITAKQLGNFVLNQEVKVFIDGSNHTIELPDRISWIASSAEFILKTIQTKEERTDLVYAIKLRVGNDGRLKIGMPDEVHLITI
jgi:HlyD family secretion protein